MKRTFAAAILALVLALATPRALLAQVGHLPRSSPFRDLEYRQELTWFGGQYSPPLDPAGVGPRSGAMAGLHYELRMGGPAYFTARVAGVLSERTVINPTQLIAQRVVESKTVPLMLLDLGFAINLTGFKSWHGLVPTLGGGLGIGGAFDEPDTGSFKIGFPFLLVLRPGIKFSAGGRWQGRLDATNYFHRLRYPESYFIKSTADPTVLPVDDPRNIWRRNLGLTLGVTYSYGR